MTSLQSAEAAVSSTERELSALDKLDATVTAKEAELAKIKADIATNAADSSGDFEERATLHGHLTERAFLLESDLGFAKAAANEQRKRTLDVGNSAKASLRALSNLVQQSTEAAAAEVLDQHLDVTQARHLYPQVIARFRSVLAVRDQAATTNSGRNLDEPEALAQFRGMRARDYEPLVKLAEGLTLEPAPAAKPELVAA